MKGILGFLHSVMPQSKKEKAQKNSKEYNFYIKNDLTKFSGKWIAIKNNNIVAQNARIENVTRSVERKNINNVLYAKVPKDNQCLIL